MVDIIYVCIFYIYNFNILILKINYLNKKMPTTIKQSRLLKIIAVALAIQYSG
jgi:hypothetical protein